MQGGGRRSRSLCSWQSALICYDGGWLPKAAAPNNYKHTHASLTRRYTLINTNVTLKFIHLLLSPVVQQRQEHRFDGSSVNTRHVHRSKGRNTAPCRRPAALRVLPAGVRRRFGPSLCVGLPHAVGQLVANGCHDFDELQRPLVQVQGPNSGQVGAQVPVDTRALDADQSPQIQAGPVWV